MEHLVVQLGIPIAYPRMVFLESALESKFNPLVALGRTGTMGLSGFVNKFNAEAELLDDLVSLFLAYAFPVALTDGSALCDRMTIGLQEGTKYVVHPIS